MKFKKWYATWMNIIKIKKAEKEEEAQKKREEEEK